jgi:hypothetical protein
VALRRPSGGAQIGNLEAGALGSLTSPVISALSGGLVIVAGVIAISFALPAFTRYRCSLHDHAQKGTSTAATAEALILDRVFYWNCRDTCYLRHSLFMCLSARPDSLSSGPAGCWDGDGARLGREMTGCGRRRGRASRA